MTVGRVVRDVSLPHPGSSGHPKDGEIVHSQSRNEHKTTLGGLVFTVSQRFVGGLNKRTHLQDDLLKARIRVVSNYIADLQLPRSLTMTRFISAICASNANSLC